MITLPDFSKAFDYENNFYLSCGTSRISKFVAHYELFKLTKELPGAIVECGVFKGTSLVRFASFRDMYGGGHSTKIIGFDMFDSFPETNFDNDKKYRDKFINSAGDQSISTSQLEEVLDKKGLRDNIELIQGDICKTVPEYVSANPHLKISLLNLDVDIYEPTVTILEHLYPKIVPGGVLILDDYGTFPGETTAVDTFFTGKNVQIKKFSFAMTPSYVIKKEV